MALRWTVWLWLLAGVPSAVAAEPSVVTAEPSVEREIATIRIHLANVFDPTNPHENAWPFRAVNAIHIVTKEDFLRRAIPLQVGDRVSSEEIEEAERIVRRFSFLRLVEIESTLRDDGCIDLDVWTRDAWTTKIGISIGGGGGTTKTEIGAEESNLFGLGKELNFELRNDENRTTRRLQYRDPRLFDSDRVLLLEYRDATDGKGYRVRLEHPLLRGADPFGWQFEGVRLEENVKVYRDGETSSEVQRTTTSFAFDFTRTLEGSAERTRRFGIGFYPRRELYEAVELGRPDDLPEERHSADLVAMVSYRELKFRAEAYLNRFVRVEDVPVGLDWSLRAGISPELLAGDESVWLLGGHLARGFEGASDRFAVVRLDADLRYGNAGKDRASSVGVEVKGYQRMGPHSLGVFHVHHEQAWNVQPHERYLLGGDSGLRGYDAHSFDGDGLMLINVEWRWSGTREYLNLVQLGFAAFFDSGIAADHEVWRPANWKSAAGIGLRFGIPRAASNNVLRLDLAYPFDPDWQGEKGWVVSFGSGQAF